MKSTRTSWTEWKRTWKNNKRFYGWGRDDREREKRFREWLKELGERTSRLSSRFSSFIITPNYAEKKRAAAKAEKDFFNLLKEKAKIEPDLTWKDVGSFGTGL